MCTTKRRVEVQAECAICYCRNRLVGSHVLDPEAGVQVEAESQLQTMLVHESPQQTNYIYLRGPPPGGGGPPGKP